MNTAFEFLKANPVFFLATVNGAEARVRPFGFVMVKAKMFSNNLSKIRMSRFPVWVRRAPG
jgi:uncharacterized pyridoxamine 5'-phosphate oxidase family protein